MSPLSMTEVVAAPTSRCRFNRSRIVTGVAGSFNSHLREGGLSDSFWVFFEYKKCYPELRRELVTGCTVSRYEQIETSPETIEQELLRAV